jgi:hypothetical protein
MGAVTTLPAFLDNLRTHLTALAGMSGVEVFSGPVDYLSVGTEAVVFCVERTEATFSHKTIPHLEVFETYDVEGRIWIVKPGAGETVIKEARDRAAAILELVVDELTAHMTPTTATQAAFGVDDARVTAWALEQYPVDGGRDCRLTFTISVQARFTPS